MGWAGWILDFPSRLYYNVAFTQYLEDVYLAKNRNQSETGTASKTPVRQQSKTGR